MSNPVLVSDLEARFRLLTTAEKSVAQALLDDAWAIVLTSVPALEGRMEAGLVSTGLARSVIASMVLRVLRNPEGIRQWSIDDASFTRDSALSAGGLYVSTEEIALLTGVPTTPLGHFAGSMPYRSVWS